MVERAVKIGRVKFTKNNDYDSGNDRERYHRRDAEEIKDRQDFHRRNAENTV